MSTARAILGAVQTSMEREATATIDRQHLHATLKFYCGYNPKRADDIKEMVAAGFPTLKEVSVRVTEGYYVSVFYKMPWGEKGKFFYPPRR